MSAADFTAGSVMDEAAALLNDAALSVYGYTTQLPYLKTAMRELREFMQLSNIPVTNAVTTILTIPAGTTEISDLTSPALPADLVEVQQIFERATGVDPFTPMSRVEFLPGYLTPTYTPASNFLIWAWNSNKIQLPPCTQTNDLKLNYIRELAQVVDQNTTISIINGKSFLVFRTAALVAQFAMENKERADDLNADAKLSLDRLVGVESKAKQAIFTRKRPFRASYKLRGNW